jgi:hypothetical protein
VGAGRVVVGADGLPPARRAAVPRLRARAVAPRAGHCARPHRATRRRRPARPHLADHAAVVLGRGEELSRHDVNDALSMVAPLLELLLAMDAERPGSVPAVELQRGLGRRTACAADQPRRPAPPRPGPAPVRHRNGFWFGKLRLRGDTFRSGGRSSAPQWSPAGPRGSAARLGPPGSARGDAILRSNLVSFGADGSATGAVVHRSCVDGRPAHVADPFRWSRRCRCGCRAAGRASARWWSTTSG